MASPRPARGAGGCPGCRTPSHPVTDRDHVTAAAVYEVAPRSGPDDVGPVKPSDASVARKLRDVYEGEDNSSARPVGRAIIPPLHRVLRGRWRRRESNPRPRPRRPERLQACPAISIRPPAGSQAACRRASRPFESRLGRPALPRRRARSLTPLPGPRAEAGATRYLTEARRRVRDRFRSSHLLGSRLFYEADRGPRLAALPENRPRRDLVAPVCPGNCTVARP
jgi:hypothetical protein